MISPQGLQIYLRRPVILTFDLVLLTGEVDHCVSLPRGRFALICIEIGSFVFKIYRSQVANGRTNERTDGQTERWRTLCLDPASLDWRTNINSICSLTSLYDKRNSCMRFVVCIIRMRDYFFCSETDISATVITISLKVCTMAELCPGQCLTSYDSDMFRGNQMPGQERGSGGPFLASQTPILQFDREYLENGKSQSCMPTTV